MIEELKANSQQILLSRVPIEEYFTQQNYFKCFSNLNGHDHRLKRYIHTSFSLHLLSSNRFDRHISRVWPFEFWTAALYFWI